MRDDGSNNFGVCVFIMPSVARDARFLASIYLFLFFNAVPILVLVTYNQKKR